MTTRLREIALPDFGVPSKRPELDSRIYRDRFGRFLDAAWAQGLDAVVVYADREHFANLSYLTGFDPRFEEALLVVARGRDPVIFTGPENLGIAALTPIGAEARLYRSFGLLGQRRDDTPALMELLADAGLAGAGAIGVVGWKYFTAHEAGDAAARWIDIPAYLADALRQIAPARNATDLMMAASSGLRAALEVDEIARMEFSSAHGSEALKRVLFGLRPGMTEYDAATLLRPIGLPLAAHPMISSGPRASFGLHSPTDRVIEQGDRMMMAFCYWGSSIARAGFAVHGADELPEGIRDYVEKLVLPYFTAAAEWYETIGIGVAGGTLDRSVRARIGDAFELLLNPGHLIHLDEWVHTPIYPDSAEVLRSHSVFQIDMIPASGGDYFTTNIEDGVALLDAGGRKDMAERFPETWSRIEARRAFMTDTLGLRLKPEVLPLSNLSGYLAPFMLSPHMAMTLR